MARRPAGFYVPLDVNYPRDPAIRAAGEAAELLYIRALCYSKVHVTDGYVAAFDLKVVGTGLRGVAKRAASLVEHGLWLPVDGGWLIRSWHRWNDQAERVSAAGTVAAHTRWHVNAGVVAPDCALCKPGPH